MLNAFLDHLQALLFPRSDGEAVDALLKRIGALSGLRQILTDARVQSVDAWREA